jgi:hypothetical protein
MTARLGDTRVLALAPEAMAADRPGGVRFVADGREGWLLAGSAAHARATLDAAGVSVDWTDLLAGTGIEVPEGDRGLWLVLARGRERS